MRASTSSGSARFGAKPPSSPVGTPPDSATSRLRSAWYTSAPALTASFIDVAPMGQTMNSWKSSGFGACAPPFSTLKQGTGRRAGWPNPGNHSYSGLRAETDNARARAMDAPMIACLLYTSDAADDLLCVDLGGR